MDIESGNNSTEKLHPNEIQPLDATQNRSEDREENQPIPGTSNDNNHQPISKVSYHMFTLKTIKFHHQSDSNFL